MNTTKTENDDSAFIIDVEDGVEENALARFVFDAAGGEDIALDEISGAHTNKVVETFSVPLLFTLEDGTRRTTYQRGDIAAQIAKGTLPEGGVWLEVVDLKMTFKKAISIYKDRLLAFERVYRISKLDITGVNVRRRVEQSIRLLVHRPRSSA